MRLAADEITLRFGNGSVLFLKPSLRAAARLERRYGFPALYQGVAEGSLTIVTDLIRAGANDATWQLDLDTSGLVSIRPLLPALLDFVMMLNGLDDDEAEPETDREVARVTFAEHYERLFRLATGWLGWSPYTALNATPHEITEAYLGRVDMLKAIYGGGEEQPAPDTRSVDEKISAGLRILSPFVVKEAEPSFTSLPDAVAPRPPMRVHTPSARAGTMWNA